MEEKRLFLLDAFALIFRAYYALIKMPRLTQGGLNTSAIFGFVNTLEEILRKEKPTHIAVCFDPQGPTFRSEADASYKAERDSMPEDIRISIPIIKEIIKAYNIPVIEVEGFEADDVIGTMSKKAESQGFTTYMMTPDKDFGQLVSANVLQYKPSYRGQDFELRGEEEVCARYGIQNTRQVIDLLALMGDKIDNIPGCPGIGEKTAVKLINDFGSVEELLKRTDELKGALKKKVEENRQQILDSYFLATIRTDVPVDIQPDDLIRKPEDKEKLFAIFKELEFRSLKERVEKRLESTSGKKQDFSGSLFDFDNEGKDEEIKEKPEDFPVDWKIITTKEDLDSLSGKLLIDQCGFCFLADGENDMESLIIGAAIAVSDKEAYYIPANFIDGIAMVLDLMAREDITKVSFEAKRAYVLGHRLRNNDTVPLKNYFDVSVAHYLVQPEMRHSADTLASRYLNHTMPSYPVLQA